MAPREGGSGLPSADGYLSSAQKAMGVAWKDQLEKALDTLRRESAGTRKALLERMNQNTSKILDSITQRIDESNTRSVEVSQQVDAIANRQESESRSLAEVWKLFAQMMQYLVDQKVSRATEVAERADRSLFDLDHRWGLAANFWGQSIVAMPNQSSFSYIGYLVGVIFTYDITYFDLLHRMKLLFAFGLFIGQGRASGGYEGPNQAFVSRDEFQATVLAARLGLAFRTALGQRTSLELGPSLSAGEASYAPVSGADTFDLPLFGSVQIPIDVGLVYKPWNAAAIGVSVGGGPELFAREPALVYTGVGADTTLAGSLVRPMAEAGVHVGYCW